MNRTCHGRRDWLIDHDPLNSTSASHAGCWNQEIAGDQLEPVVLAPQASLTQGMDCRAGRGPVPEPVSELSA
jgi:hypothetical protein